MQKSIHTYHKNHMYNKYHEEKKQLSFVKLIKVMINMG